MRSKVLLVWDGAHLIELMLDHSLEKHAHCSAQVVQDFPGIPDQVHEVIFPNAATHGML